MTFNMQLITSLDNDINDVNRRIESLQENQIMLDAELTRLSPSLPR